MTTTDRPRHVLHVLGAGALVLGLAGTFAVRLAARSERRPDEDSPRRTAALAVPPAPATVPDPSPIDVSELPPPTCWSCPWEGGKPLDFTVDLDMLAPLGTGDSNAALWFRDFTLDGPRREELPAKRDLVNVKLFGRGAAVLPADHPLLLEAERWIDQRTCRFYPDQWKIEGLHTQIPNLLFTIQLAKSWVARGLAEADTDPEAAAADYRRAIRVGRLVMQDRVTLIKDLVGQACIALGAEGLYELAREQGDTATMLVAGHVLADRGSMRLVIAREVTVANRLYDGLHRGFFGIKLDASDERVDDVVRLARRGPSSALRSEGVLSLHVVLGAGTDEQRDLARTTLEELAGDDDVQVAALATWSLEHPLDEEALTSMGLN